MTYTAHEYSVQDGDPVFRFLFVQGATEYRYTTAPYISADSNGTWEPVALDPSQITQSNEMAKDAVKLSIPRDNTFARLFLGGVPEQITSVTIFRGHQGDVDEEFSVYWKGRVAGASATGDTVTLECENIFTSMRRPGLRARYQKTCRHALYGRGCNLNDYDFAMPGVVTAASGFLVTIQGLTDSNGSIADGYLTGGMIETADGFLRYITKHAGTQLTLIRPFPALEEEVESSNGLANVTLYPGCDHTRTTCKEKFNNLDNFGGFPWIPGKNPFGNDVSGSIV
ncbi:MAG: phage BR0599 family protein [Alcanivoracaceae bacterium]|nr:phage BR0599 family protein [Alcanivoracaceae bacterium]